MRRLLIIMLIVGSIASQFGTGAIARFTDNDQSPNNTFSAWDIAPAAPSGLAASPGDDQVSLNWNDNSEPDLNGYNVYRSIGTGGPYSQINGSLVVTSDYIDSTVTNNTTYYYVVTAVDIGTNESGYSNEASATPIDTGPAAPTGLAATPGDDQIGLDWDDNSESDIDGYNVFRATTSSGPYSQINGSLVVTSDYIDTTVTELVPYYYVVTAVDNEANESPYSNEANATPNSITILDDGFEGTPWDGNWDENGITDWQLSWAGGGYGGSTYCAIHYADANSLTSNDLNTSDAAGITVTFWFYIKSLIKGPLYVQTYNGTGYNNWYELTTYPGVVKTTWIQFSQVITDSQYFRSDFRIKIDGSGIATDVYLDDVLVVKH